MEAWIDIEDMPGQIVDLGQIRKLLDRNRRINRKGTQLLFYE